MKTNRLLRFARRKLHYLINYITTINQSLNVWRTFERISTAYIFYIYPKQSWWNTSTTLGMVIHQLTIPTVFIVCYNSTASFFRIIPFSVLNVESWRVILFRLITYRLQSIRRMLNVKTCIVRSSMSSQNQKEKKLQKCRTTKISPFACKKRYGSPRDSSIIIISSSTLLLLHDTFFIFALLVFFFSFCKLIAILLSFCLYLNENTKRV